MKKILSIVLAAVMLISMMAVNVFAEDEHVLFEFDCGEGLVHTGWTEIFTAEAADFAAALQQEGAKLVVDATVEGTWAQIHVQAGDWKAVNICNVTAGVNEITPEYILEELKKVDPSFELSSIIQACSNSDGMTIKSFKVVSSVAPAETTEPAAETTEPAAETTEPAAETAPAAETSEPANTGIVLALLPMAVAAAAVVVSKRK